MEPVLPAEVAPGDRQSLFALQRAATASDPVQRLVGQLERFGQRVTLEPATATSPQPISDQSGLGHVNDRLPRR
jgi:hypothetical protein